MRERRRRERETGLPQALVCGALALACLPAVAQTGSLEVWVFGAADRAPLPGVTVVLTNQQQLIAETAVLSDAEGRVRFPVLRGGPGYAVEVSFPGFAVQRVSDLRIRSNETERLTFLMFPRQEEQVAVTARSEVIDLEQTGATNRFSDEFIAELPVPGRFYQNVLTLAPGVNDADADGNPNVHGARQRDFKAEVGGVSNVDPLTGQWLSFVHPDSIEEMEIVPAGAGVEFGRAQGGFARIIQKQGSNEFEGALSYLHRSSELDGWGAADGAEDLTPRFEWNQPSLLVSGPLVRDRLWFRLAHEWIRGEDPQNLLGTVEVMPREQEIAADQLTWQVSPRNKLAFQYQSSDLTLENYGISSTVPVESSYTLRRSGPTYSVSWLSPYSSNLLVDSQVAWQDHSFELTPTTSGVAQDCIRFYPIWYIGDDWVGYGVLDSVRCLSSETGRTSGSFPEASSDDRQRLTVRSNLTWFKSRFLGTSHRFKFGFSVEDERFHRELERKPDLNFRTQREFVVPCPIGGPVPCPAYVAYTTAWIHVPETSSATATGVTWGIYAEDQLKPAANLSLTLGLRVDVEEIDAEGWGAFDPAAEAAEFTANYNGFNDAALAQMTFTAFPDSDTFQADIARQMRIPAQLATQLVPLSTTAQHAEFWHKQQRRESIAIRNTNLSPRLTLAWDPWSTGRSKLALSAGRYYDKIFLAVPLVELEPVSTTLLFRTPERIPFGAPPTTIPSFFAGRPDHGIAPTVRRQFVDRDLDTPYQDELSLSFEHEIWKETSLGVRLIRRWFRDQFQDVDINHATGDRGYCIAGEFLTDRVVSASPGMGADLVDLYTGEPYTDTDPGPGDGRVDDCTGAVDRFVANDDVYPPVLGSTVLPDGLDDLYVLNPGWGEVLLIGNFNSAEYTAFVLELIRRRYRNWEMQSSYTWSTAEGDAEDFNQDLGNERNLREDERGALDYDQRHVLRFNATRTLPKGFRLGGVVRWESGLPYSLLESRETLFSVPPDYNNIGDAGIKYRFRYPTGERNDQRNPSYWNLDAMVAKDFALGRSAYLGLSAEIFNLLEDDTVILGDQIDGTNSGVRRFGRRYQLGARLSF